MDRAAAAFRSGVAVCRRGVAAWWLPQVLELFSLINATVYTAMAVLALSLGLVWGFGGILCFGQAAFFGLGGYAYAVGALNFTDSDLGRAHRAAGADVAAAALGYCHVLRPDQRCLHGRHHPDGDADPVQFHQLHRRRGMAHRRGAARRLQRHPVDAAAQHPRRPRHAARRRSRSSFSPSPALPAVYVLCKAACCASHFGRVVVAIRENELRAALLGYDVRLTSSASSPSAGRWRGWRAAVRQLASSSARRCSAWPIPRRSSSGSWSAALGTLVGPVVGAMLCRR